MISHCTTAFALALSLLGVHSGEDAAWRSPVETAELQAPLFDDTGKPVAFSSSDPAIVFIVPRIWTLGTQGGRVWGQSKTKCSPKGERFYEIEFLLSPSYRESAAFLADRLHKRQDEAFSRLPLRVSQVELALPPEIGEVVRQVRLSHEALGGESSMFFRLRTDDAGLGALRALSGPLGLTGSLTYEFYVGKEKRESVAPISISFPERFFEGKKRSCTPKADPHRAPHALRIDDLSGLSPFFHWLDLFPVHWRLRIRLLKAAIAVSRHEHRLAFSHRDASPNIEIVIERPRGTNDNPTLRLLARAKGAVDLPTLGLELESVEVSSATLAQQPHFILQAFANWWFSLAEHKRALSRLLSESIATAITEYVGLSSGGPTHIEISSLDEET